MNDSPMSIFHTANPFIDPETATEFTQGHLPHRNQHGKVFFVTFRLNDSIPRHVAESYHNHIKQLPKDIAPSELEQHVRLAIKKLMDCMDRGHGSCQFNDPQRRKTLEDKITWHDRHTCDIHAYVIMPNHVHAVIETYDGQNIISICGSIKKFSSIEINKSNNTAGAIWQRETFDRIIRNIAHYARSINYIRNNPRNLHETEYTLYIRDDVKELLNIQ